MRMTPGSQPYGGRNVTRGTHRPDAWPNLWISDPQAGFPAWLELEWDRQRQFSLVQVTFDTNFSQRASQPLFRYPECVKDYDLRVRRGGGWVNVASIRGNYVRRRVHRFDRVGTDALRLEVLAANGAPSARVYEIRVYDEL
jgi:hypothetical protein